MKNLKLILCACLLMSGSAFAQFVEGADLRDMFLFEVKAHDNSPNIKNFISDIEAKYEVTCHGFTSPTWPYLLPRMTYKATCKNEDYRIKLKINSSYAPTKDGYVFSIRRYAIKIKD